MTFRTRAVGLTIASAAIVFIASMATSAQTLQTKQVMQRKLAQSQLLLGDVVTSNWAALDRHTRALGALTRDPGWDVMHMPEFHDRTTAFQKAVAALLDAAGKRDQQTAATAYNGLVSSCVECHRYVALSRVVTVR